MKSTKIPDTLIRDLENHISDSFNLGFESGLHIVEKTLLWLASKASKKDVIEWTIKEIQVKCTRLNIPAPSWLKDFEGRILK